MSHAGASFVVVGTVEQSTNRRLWQLLKVVGTVTALSAAAACSGNENPDAGTDEPTDGATGLADPDPAQPIAVTGTELGELGGLDWAVVEWPAEWLSRISFGSPDGSIITANDDGVRVTTDGASWTEIDLPTFPGEGTTVVATGTNSSTPGQFHLTLRTEVGADADVDPHRCTDETVTHRWRLATFAEGRWTSRLIEELTVHTWNAPIVWALTVAGPASEQVVVHTRSEPTTRFACLFPDYDSGQPLSRFDEVTPEGFVDDGELTTWAELGVPSAALGGTAGLQGSETRSAVYGGSDSGDLVEVLTVSGGLRTDGEQLYSTSRSQLSEDLGETWIDVTSADFNLEVFGLWSAPWRVPAAGTFTGGVSGPIHYRMWIDGEWVPAPRDDGDFEVRPDSLVGDVLLGTWNDMVSTPGAMTGAADLIVPNFSIATWTGDTWYRFDPSELVPDAQSLVTLGSNGEMILVADADAVRWDGDGQMVTEGTVLVAVGMPHG